MTSIADGSVIIQTSAEFVPSTPSWFGEVVLMAAHLRQHGVHAPSGGDRHEQATKQTHDDGWKR